jgi:hypothetical protein
MSVSCHFSQQIAKREYVLSVNPECETLSYQGTVALVHKYPMCVQAFRLSFNTVLIIVDGAQAAGYLLNVFLQGILTVQFRMSSLTRLAELTQTR